MQDKIIFTEDQIDKIRELIWDALEHFSSSCPHCERDIDIGRYVSDEDIYQLINTGIKR